jgi:hypothetical protein
MSVPRMWWRMWCRMWPTRVVGHTSDRLGAMGKTHRQGGRTPVVQSGDFTTTSGIYRMNDHPGREVTLIYGDTVPMFQAGCPQLMLWTAPPPAHECHEWWVL